MKENKEPTHWLWKYVAAILFFAAAVNGAMYLPIPTLSTLTSGDWLGFWGGYLGGVIGCIPAIAALLHSQAEAKRLHEETAEAQRCSVMPMFTVDLTLVPPSSTNEEVELCSECIALNPDGTLTRKTPLSSLQSLTFMFNHRQSHLPYLCCLKNIGLGPVSDFYIIPSTCADPPRPKSAFRSVRHRRRHLFCPVSAQKNDLNRFTFLFRYSRKQILAILQIGIYGI